jgi:hypothetical protein
MKHDPAGMRSPRALAATAAALTVQTSLAASPQSAAPKIERPAAVPSMSTEARTVAQWVQDSRDNGGLPFAVLDKRAAHLWLFDARGGRLASTPVLLGLARGDASVPGIGEREMHQIRPHERTTPAGRFVVEPGRNTSGEDIFWVDYDAAVSMHRVRATNPAERRLQRLATQTPRDNRISYGCINVPAHFYDSRIRPLFGARRGVVYVLPETMPAAKYFGIASAKKTADPRTGKGPLRRD